MNCSWLNQVEQGFRLPQRKRRRIAGVAALADLERRLLAFVAEWNQRAHPFRWTTAPFAKVLAGRPQEEAPALPVAIDPAPPLPAAA